MDGGCLRLRLVNRGRDDLGNRDIFLLRISRVHGTAGRLSCTRSCDVLVPARHGQDEPDRGEQGHERGERKHVAFRFESLNESRGSQDSDVFVISSTIVSKSILLGQRQSFIYCSGANNLEAPLPAFRAVDSSIS